MFDGARPGDTLCLNIDDPYVSAHPRPEGVRVITYGAHPDAEVRMMAAEVDPDTLHTRFTVRMGDEIATGLVPSPGVHMAHNAVGAICVGAALGLPLQGMVDRIGTYAPVGMRLRMEPGPLGTQIINDAYNANPMSGRQPPTLAAIPRAAGRRRVALLGDSWSWAPPRSSTPRDYRARQVARPRPPRACRSAIRGGPR